MSTVLVAVIAAGTGLSVVPVTATPASAAAKHGGRPHPQKVWRPNQVKDMPSAVAHDAAKSPAQPARARTAASQPAAAPSWPAAGVFGFDLTVAPAKAHGVVSKLASMEADGTIPPVNAASAGSLVKSGNTVHAAATAKTSAPTSVRVTVADHSVAAALGIPGVVVSVARTDGSAKSGSADVAISYDTWASAFGGNFTDRLRVVALPACALTTPRVAACRVQTPVTFTNDHASKQLLATVNLPAGHSTGSGRADTSAAAPVETSTASVATQPMVLAATSSASGANGTYSASPLKPSDSWSASGNSGSFEWSYPMTTPTSLGSGGTNLSLAYDSGSVDGRTTVTSGQTSVVGEGFDLGGASSYIETSYEPCSRANATDWAASGDMCVGTPNATISGGAHAGQLVRDDTDTSKWRLATDDGTRVQLLYGTEGGSNNTANQAYWKLTATDGTVYLYGANRLPSAYGGSGADNPTYSAWSVPVFGTGSGTSCNDPTGTEDPQSCLQAWRWNLDFVIDPHGNVTRYSYARETDNYQHKTATTGYTRSGFLREIDYGWQQADVATAAGLLADNNASGARPASTVRFVYAPRCVHDTTNNPSCPTAAPTVTSGIATTGITGSVASGTGNYSAFLDVPWDQHCDAGSTSCTVYSPAYFSTVRLTGIQTAVNTGATIAGQPSWTPGNYEAVDSWSLNQSFPEPLDYATTGNRAQLRLDSVVHTGYVTNSDGTVATTSAPSVNFGYIGNQPNRVRASWNSLSVGTDAPLFYRFRLNNITDELGTETAVAYQAGSGAQDCSTLSSAPPTTIANTTLCYPEYFDNNGTMVTDWYNKYLVTSVTVTDETTTHTGYIYAPLRTVNYTYLGNPAWHTNDSEQADPKYRTVDGFRGFRQVQAASSGESLGHNTKTVTTYFQGMDQDPGTYVCLNDSHQQAPANANCPGGYGYRDDNALMGQALEVQTYASEASNTIVDDEISVPEDPTDAGMVTAAHTRISPLPAQRAHFSHVQKKISYQQVSTSSTPRRSEIDYTYDNSLPTFTGDGGVGGNGHLYLTDDKGDGTVQELCSLVTYAGNTALGADGAQWTAYPMETITSTVPSGSHCSPSSETAATTVAQTLSVYDNQSPATVVHGDVTTTKSAPSFNGSWVTTGQATYDRYGRQISTTDANSNTSTITFTPATGLLPSQVATKNPAGWTATTIVDRGHGLSEASVDVNSRRSDATYDGLGRVTKDWDPSHSKADNPTTPVNIYSYGLFGVSGGAATNAYIETQTLREDDSYAQSVSILDGFGDQIQTQATPADGSAGLVFTQAEYNTLGKPWRTASADYDSAHTPSGTFHNYGDALPSQTVTTYDGMGRPLTVAQESLGVAVPGMVTTTAYPGLDRTDVTSPAGNGVASAGATSTFTDVRGRTTALWTYHNNPPSPTGNAADADITRYGFQYVANGTQSTVTDATSKNTWTTTTTDLLGRHVVKQDPDTGTSQTWSDNAGLLRQSQDGRGQVLSYSYDILGRKTGEYNAASTALTLDANKNITAVNPAAAAPSASTKLAAWAFDTAPGSDGKPTRGLPASSTRYTDNGTSAYTTATTGYDAGSRPLGSTVTVPAADGNGTLAGTYQTNDYYTPVTGLLDHVDLPAAGNLPSETVYNSYNVNGLLMATGGNADYVVDTQYDQLGRILSRTLGDYPYQIVQETLYDPATNRVTNTFTDATAGQNPNNTSQLNTYSIDDVSYTYDAAGRITSTADLENWTVSGSYDPPAARDVQCYTYDYASRLTNAWTDTGDQTPPSTSNPPGPSTTNPTTVVTSSAKPGGLGSCASSTSNNPPTTASAQAGQISGSTATGAMTSPAPYWQSFAFDGTGTAGLGNGAQTGNRSTSTDHDITGTTANDVTSTSVYPTAGTTNTAGSATTSGTGPHLLNQLIHSGGATGTNTYHYDGAGNTTVRPGGTNGQHLTWDAENRLATVTDVGSGATATYLYDADGNQLIRRDTNGTSGTSTLFLGDQEIHLTTKAGTSTLTGQRYYSYPGAPLIIADQDGNYSYETTNNQSTGTTSINATNNQITAHRHTKPYGDPRGTNPTNWPDDHTFLGKTTDSSTGLVDIGARKYDPATGRFISADPLFQANLPQTLGGYTYAGDDPVSSSDPSGLGQTKLVAGGGGSEPSAPEKPSTPGSTTTDSDYSSVCPSTQQGCPGYVDAELAKISPKRLSILKADVQHMCKDDLQGCLDPTSITYENILDRTAWAINGPLTWNEFVNGSKGATLQLAVSALAFAVCKGVPACMMEGAAWAGLAGACAQDCTNGANLAAQAVIGIALGRPGAIGDQVAYGSTDLSQEALTARILDNNKRNLYAVARYTEANGAVRTLAVNSNAEGHAEANVLSRLAELGIDPSQVTDLYVEFQPCSGTVNCTTNVIPKFTNPNFKLTYSFDWNSSSAVQIASQSALKNAINELWP